MRQRREKYFDEFHEEYRSINTGAHRKSGIEVDTPTLVRHLSFWYPAHSYVKNSEKPDLSVAYNGPLINEYIKKLYKNLKRLKRFETNAHISYEEAGVEKTGIVFFGKAFDFVNEEFFDLDKSIAPAIVEACDSDSRIIYFKSIWHGLHTQVRLEFHSEYFTVSVFLTLPEKEKTDSLVANMFGHLAVLPDNASGAIAGRRRKKAYQFIYQRIWQVFFDENIGRNPQNGLKVFADFRGLILAGRDVSAQSAEVFDLTSFKKSAPGQQFRAEWVQKQLVPVIWPFLTCETDLEMKRREFTVSFMLDRRAVYLTALGPQPAPGTTNEFRPVHYLLVARPVNDWQLGSLLDRIHFMGTTRLAALMELSALRTAGANLKAVEFESDSARDALQTKNYPAALSHVTRMNNLICHRDIDEKPLFRNGLQFRVERSRYYVSRFQANEVFLRIERVEGFQPYIQFVEGRLGGVYDYINRLGRRQERAVKNASNISQEIQNNQTQKIMEDIEAIQFKAEIALLLVLIPYYFIAMVHYIAEAFQRNEEGLAKAYVSIALIFPILALLNVQDYFTKKKIRIKELWRPAFKAIMAVAVTVVVAFGIMHVVLNNEKPEKAPYKEKTRSSSAPSAPSDKASPVQ